MGNSGKIGMISSLPISAGDETTLVFLKPNKYSDNKSGGITYSTDWYEPIFPPIFGEYDDYGKIESVKIIEVSKTKIATVTLKLLSLKNLETTQDLTGILPETITMSANHKVFVPTIVDGKAVGEWATASEIKVGTLLMFGGAAEVTIANLDTTAVAGIVSTNPAHLMNGQLTGSNVIPLALQGRVPCMVIGPIKKGDMLVSAGFGYAKASENPQIGQVIGKALQDYSSPSKAVIEVVVGRV